MVLNFTQLIYETTISTKEDFCVHILKSGGCTITKTIDHSVNMPVTELNADSHPAPLENSSGVHKQHGREREYMYCFRSMESVMNTEHMRQTENKDTATPLRQHERACNRAAQAAFYGYL